MASIVKELDKVSGTTTRSHNIADAVSKLKMGGGDGSSDARTVVALHVHGTGENIKVTYLSEGSNASGLSFEDIYNLYQKHDLAISIADTGAPLSKLQYNEASPSWGLPARFGAVVVTVKPGAGQIIYNDIDIDESKQVLNATYYNVTISANS